MKEIKDIIKAYDQAIHQGQQTALATVVHVEGSSYRRPGARMLVTQEGMLTGAISGGCLEGDALRKALLVMSANKKMLVTYDTNDEDDAKLGMGLGCNGIIQVLIEPVDANDANNPVQLLKTIAERRQNAVLITLFSLADRKATQPGTCLLIKEDRSVIGEKFELTSALQKDAANAFENNSSSFKNYLFENTSLTAFIEFIKPAVSLVIAGAGNDVMPLVDMAMILGWETTIVDGRPNYAKAERFSSGCKVLLAKPGAILQHISIDSQTVFALMTHNYNYDMALLRELSTHLFKYAGLLGPKKKRDRLINELKEMGIIFSEQQIASIHGPVGLDIGAETPEEIALSVVAEIQAVLSDKTGRQLRVADETIHSRSAMAIEDPTTNQEKIKPAR